MKINITLFTIFLYIFSAQVALSKPLEVDNIRNIYAIAVHPQDSARLLLATKTGLYVTTKNNEAEPLARLGDRLISLAVSPGKNSTLYASGSPAIGGNLGLLSSNDSGKTWKQLSRGANGPVGFRHLIISRSDPKTIYGTYQGLQVSRDGGKNWQQVAPLPPNLYALAVSAKDPLLLYAGTKKGLYVSRDGGKSWNDPYGFDLPVTMVNTLSTGRVYTFVVGRGLLRGQEGKTEWVPVNNKLGAQVLTQLIATPDKKDQLYALNHVGKILSSQDGGKNWQRIVSGQKTLTKAAERGKTLFKANCQKCHGINGVGENYSKESLANRKYRMAPPLDYSAHGWHHADVDIMKTILNGAPENKRMIAWKKTLSEKDVSDLLAYIRSLWDKRALDCQGPKHMKCG
ncbi:MAG: hypothetical protein BMS9Abin26_1432 [Gammaproteobacteria bacterium]|nr:MAG: hypothetical protein BMS9Abin26_1432 [Gammaproteobacteria bacterium]